MKKQNFLCSWDSNEANPIETVNLAHNIHWNIRMARVRKVRWCKLAQNKTPPKTRTKRTWNPPQSITPVLALIQPHYLQPRKWRSCSGLTKPQWRRALSRTDPKARTKLLTEEQVELQIDGNSAGCRAIGSPSLDLWRTASSYHSIQRQITSCL